MVILEKIKDTGPALAMLLERIKDTKDKRYQSNLKGDFRKDERYQ